MSRIDEALHRAGEQVSPAGRVSPASEVFDSPWVFVAGDEERPRPVERGALLSMHVAAAGQPAAIVDGFNPNWRDRLATSPQADWLLVEQFRRLAATLHQAQADAGIRTVMVTSASAGDGKTLTAINLALTLSESYGRRVLLVDADLRRPAIRDVSHMPNVIGLSGGLRAVNDQPLTVLPITTHLTLLPAGRPDPDPMSSLTSSRMRRILEDAAQRFEWVILDAPPVGGIADTSLLANMVDAALLVVRAGETKCAVVRKAIDALGRDRLLGVVLNGVDKATHQAYEYSYSHYGSKDPVKA